MKKYSLLIFDWDGTLMDSRGYMMKKVKNFDSGLMSAAISAGVGFLEKMRHQNIDRHYENYYFNQLAKNESGPQLFSGVSSTLQALKDQGYTLVVATSMSRKSLDTMMQRFQTPEFFSASRCSEETAPKPDPAMLSSLLEEFSFCSDQALMIGDTENDMLMAQRIGMDRVAMTTGIHDIERLQKYEPIACLDDIQKLTMLLSPCSARSAGQAA